MVTLRDEFEERAVVQPLQLRLLRGLVQGRADVVLRLGRNSERRPRFGNLIYQPGIYCASLVHAVRALVMDERFPEKLAHASIDFSRSEIVVIEKNLELNARFFVVVGKRHWNRGWRRCLWLWRRFRTGRRGFIRRRLRSEGSES